MSTIKLQVPIDESVRIGLEKRAKELGFDSAQAYIRVWAKAETEGRKLDFGNNATVLSLEAANRYDDMVKDLDVNKRKGNVESFESTSDFLEDLKS